MLEGGIKIGWDALNVIKKAIDSETIYSCLSNHVDPISAINHKIRKSPLTWFWRRIKGRQDDKTVPLYIWATLNVGCDTEAKHKCRIDQEELFINTRSHNIQYDNCKLFKNPPTSSEGE